MEHHTSSLRCLLFCRLKGRIQLLCLPHAKALCDDCLWLLERCDQQYKKREDSNPLYKMHGKFCVENMKTCTKKHWEKSHSCYCYLRVEGWGSTVSSKEMMTRGEKNNFFPLFSSLTIPLSIYNPEWWQPFWPCPHGRRWFTAAFSLKEREREKREKRLLSDLSGGETVHFERERLNAAETAPVLDSLPCFVFCLCCDSRGNVVFAPESLKC